MEKNKIYTVRYSRRVVLDTRVIVVFATYDEHLAKRYVRKFNRILAEAKEYWKDYQYFIGSLHNGDFKHSNRVEQIFDTYDAYYLETEIR